MTTDQVEYAPVGGHLPELDGIRGAACLMVVLLHAFFGIMTPGFKITSIEPIVDAFFGGAGVDLFFVLSGFLIGGILIDHRDAPNYFKVFWARRAARILPVYLLLFLTYAVALSISGNVKADWFHAFLMQDPLPIWTYLTFTQNYFMAAANSGAARWVGITWSLAVEEQFYLVFPFVVYFLPKKTVIGIALVTIVLAVFIRAYLWDVGGFYTGYFPTPARADGLMFGVLVAYAIRSDGVLAWFKRHRALTDVFALAAAVILIWFINWMPMTVSFTLRSAIFSYVIGRIFFSGDLMRVFLRSRIMVALGAISYPFYMYHQAINGLFHGLFLGQVPRIDNWQGVLVAVAVLLTSAILATLSTQYFEKPFRAMGKRAKYQHAISAIPAAA